jgi:type II secretion system protein C
MDSAFYSGVYSGRILVIANRTLAGLALATAVGLSIQFVRLPTVPPNPDQIRCKIDAYNYKANTYDINNLGLVFRVSHAENTAPNATLSPFARFRLAGTFMEYGSSTANRKAVVQNTESGRQWIVGENDLLEDDIRIASIALTSVTLQDASGSREVLRLGFTGTQRLVGHAESRNGTGAGTGKGLAGRSFHAQQVGESSWIFRRENLMEYYGELRNEPERLLNVFDSMKPVYNDERVIEGYRLGIEGEADFFAAVGLRENDIVRSVNRQKLRNRRVAEAFIADFVGDNASAFVLEVERDGQKRNFVYQIR